MKIKIDSKKALKIGSTVVGIVVLLIDNLVSKNEREDMKADIIKELSKDLSKEK